MAKSGSYDELEFFPTTGGSFVRFSQEACSLLVLERSKSSMEYLVLFLLCSMAKSDNVAQVTPVMVRKALHLSDSQYDKVIRSLIKRNFITKCLWHGNAHFFMLNPVLFRKFKDDQLKMFVKTYREYREQMKARYSSYDYTTNPEKFNKPPNQIKAFPTKTSRFIFEPKETHATYGF